MPTSKRKTDAPAAADEKPSAAVFLYEQVIGMDLDDERLPGPDTAAVLAAQQAGHVIVGAPHVERTVSLGVPHAVCITWSVPIKAG